MRQLLLFSLLYFSEGAPIGFLWWAMPTILRTRGVSVADISGLTAVLVLPWTFKFLVAPVVDILRNERWSHKHWVIVAQLGMGLALLPLVWLPLEKDFTLWTRLLILHAFFASVQDVSVDALAVNSTEQAERGRLNAWMQAGMLVGRGVFGGVSIWLAAQWGLGRVMAVLIAAIWCSMGFLMSYQPPPAAPIDRAQYFSRLKETFRSTTVWWAMGFTLTAEAAFKSVGGLAGPLLVDRGADDKQNALFFSVVIAVAMIVGSLLGGRMADRSERIPAVRRALFISLGTVFLCGLLVRAGAPLEVLFVSLALVYAAGGLFVTTSYAMLMDFTAPSLAAFQFSLFMACVNGCESWSVALCGRLQKPLGYGGSFLALACVAGTSLLFLSGLEKDRIERGERA